MTMTVPTGFARLLASENISVRVDVQAPTAYFDTKSRVLTLPAWDCSERLRDMLIGHECAHAIFTNDGGDLIGAIRKVGSDEMLAKGYLNIVEDVRIDRLIQRRYPGLRIDYKAGLREMWERDFFGVAGRDVNDLSLADRINCHFKGSPTTIRFNAAEQVFVDRAERIETFEDAIDLARDLYDYCANNETENQAPVETGGEDFDFDFDADGEEGDSNADGASAGPEGENGKAQGKSGSDADGESDGESSEGKGKGTADGGESDDDGSTAESTRGSTSQQGREGESQDASRDESSSSKGVSKGHTPTAPSTLKAQEDAISNNLRRQTGRYDSSANYAIPTGIKAENIVIPFADVLREIALRAGELDHTNEPEWIEFKSGAKTTITNLSQMFDRKKAAAINQRSQVAKTGRLDMTNLHKYKMTEDIFLRNRVVVKGKNHGLVMFVDWSGSMQDCMNETVQQAVMLAMFCKKVNIPFRVYAFSSYFRDEWYNNNTGEMVEQFVYPSVVAGIENLRGNLFSLIELFSEKMNQREFDTMAAALIKMGKGGMYYGTPAMLQLGGTPLNESIMAAMHLAKKFREETRVDVMNSVWITDGGDMNPMYGSNGLVSDRATGEVWGYDSRDSKCAQGTDLLFRIYKSKIGGNLIGIYLEGAKSALRRISYLGSSYYGETNPDPKRYNAGKMTAQFKQDQFVEYPHKGYDTYFLMDKKVAVYTGSDEVESLPDNASTTRAINAFKRDLARRAVSRPLLNAFTDKIAREMV